MNWPRVNCFSPYSCCRGVGTLHFVSVKKRQLLRASRKFSLFVLSNRSTMSWAIDLRKLFATSSGVIAKYNPPPINVLKVAPFRTHARDQHHSFTDVVLGCDGEWFRNAKLFLEDFYNRLRRTLADYVNQKSWSFCCCGTAGTINTNAKETSKATIFLIEVVPPALPSPHVTGDFNMRLYSPIHFRAGLRSFDIHT